MKVNSHRHSNLDWI